MPTANNSKTIAVIFGIYLTVLQGLCSYSVFEKAINIQYFVYILEIFLVYLDSNQLLVKI